MITTIIQNVALLIAIVVVYQFVIEKWEGGNWQSRAIIGLLFGAVGIVSMMTPFVFTTGVVIDGRSIILAVAGFIGGPAVAIIAAAICALYRISMGGAGVLIGISVITISTLIGVGFYYLRQKDNRAIRPISLWGFGMVIHLAMVSLLWFVPDIGPDLVRNTAAIVLILFPLATLLVCQTFLDRERQIETRKKLHASEQYHRTTLMSIGDAVISTDADGRVLLMNNVAENLTGWTQNEAAGLPLETIFKIVCETSREAVENPATKVRREGIVVGLANHTLLISRDGKEHPIADSAAPIKDSQGALSGVVLVFRDQTAEREAETKLRSSERQLSDLMSHLPGMVYRCRNDAEWTAEFVSNGCLELTGFPATEFLDPRQPKQLGSLIHPDDHQRIQEETAAAVRENRAYSLNYRLRTADGDIKWVEERGRALADKTTRDWSLQGFIFDVTERYKAEQEKSRLETELKQAHKMEAIGRLAGGVAHDFNNMLSVINGYTEMALSAPADKDTTEYLTAVLEAGKRSADLTRQLLAFARKQTIAPRILDLNETIEGMLSMLSRLIGENIEIVWRPGKEIDFVHIDPTQIDQVMINLMINARDAIDSTGKITVSTEMMVLKETDDPPIRKMPPGSYVLLSIADDGPGVDSKLLPHVFEPFFTTKSTGQGVGLGLATVYGIASQNGGFVDLSSAAGEGAVFRIFLPAQPARRPENTVPTDPAEPASGDETILLVEDEASILNLSQAYLESIGYHVLAATSPREAIRVAEEFEGSIALLVTDVIMPEMNGRDLWLRLNKRHGIRCLYISGYTADHIQDQGILTEEVNFLEKPFSLEALAKEVRAAITDGSSSTDSDQR